jgi:DNA polymerase III sliding clamp (beta) subunit (PCNA family)
MKIAVTTKWLQNAIKLVAAFTKPNRSLPILETVCLRPRENQKIQVCTTNLECTGIATIPYDLITEWGAEESRGICIPCGMLLKTIEKMPDEDDSLFIETEPETGKTLFYNASRSRNFSFSTIYADMDYGDSVSGWDPVVRVTSDIWVNLLKKAIPCTSDDDLKQAMTCIRLESEPAGEAIVIRSIATDAHCLCINQESTTFFTGSETIEALLPKAAIAAILPHLNGAMPTELLECRSKYVFRFLAAAGIQTEISFKKLDAKFPDYVNVIPRISGAKASILCNRKALLETMKRSGIYANSTTSLGKFTFNLSKNLIFVEVEDMDNSRGMQENINVGITKLNADLPEVFEIGLNSKLLSRILGLLTCEEILIYYYSPTSALLIEDADIPFEVTPSKENILQQRFLLMPVMLNY